MYYNIFNSDLDYKSAGKGLILSATIGITILYGTELMLYSGTERHTISTKVVKIYYKSTQKKYLN